MAPNRSSQPERGGRAACQTGNEDFKSKVFIQALRPPRLWSFGFGAAFGAGPDRLGSQRCAWTLRSATRTSIHDWLEGRGREPVKLIAMIDDASGGLTARFVREDSTSEPMKMLRDYLEAHGRPLAFYTDKAGEPAAGGIRRADD